MHNKNSFGDAFKKFFGSPVAKQVPKKKSAPQPQPKSVLYTQPLIKKEVEKVELSMSKPNPAAETVDYKAKFMTVFKRLTYTYRSWDIWKDFIVMFACSISNSVDKRYYDNREKLYLKTIKRYKKDEQMMFVELVAYTVMALETNQEQDFFGYIFMELKLGNESGGQFFTPYHVAEFMSAVTLEDCVRHINDKGYFTIHDSCCGAGVMLIASINETRKILEKENLNHQNHMLVTGQDIDLVTALMCYIQISLLGVAGYVKVGNALTEPMCDNDDLSSYWFTPIYFSEVWSMRRMFRSL